MSEFWKRKMRRYFATFDFDSDGLISKYDFDGMATQFSKFGNPEKQQVDDLKAYMKQLWELYWKYADVGNRDQMTPDELIYSIGKLRYSQEMIKIHTGLITGFHDMLDLNRDGYLQENEYQQILFQMGVPDPSFVKEAFKAIDVNGDEKLSLEEFLNAYFDFMFSDDEKSPNTFFFGPLGD